MGSSIEVTVDEGGVVVRAWNQGSSTAAYLSPEDAQSLASELLTVTNRLITGIFT